MRVVITAAAGHPHHVQVAELEKLELKLSTEVDRHERANDAKAAMTPITASAASKVVGPRRAASEVRRSLAAEQRAKRLPKAKYKVRVERGPKGAKAAATVRVDVSDIDTKGPRRWTSAEVWQGVEVVLVPFRTEPYRKIVWAVNVAGAPEPPRPVERALASVPRVPSSLNPTPPSGGQSMRSKPMQVQSDALMGDPLFNQRPAPEPALALAATAAPPALPGKRAPLLLLPAPVSTQKKGTPQIALSAAALAPSQLNRTIGGLKAKLKQGESLLAVVRKLDGKREPRALLKSLGASAQQIDELLTLMPAEAVKLVQTGLARTRQQLAEAEGLEVGPRAVPAMQAVVRVSRAVLALPPASALPASPAPAATKDTRIPGAAATYDPGDNKLRLRSIKRLDSDTYKRLKGVGFRWAPKQGLFVAPTWTPEAEDILSELCGEIGDEDTSLVRRAEDRAVRFEGYQGKRAKEAEATLAHVDRVAGNVPFGQPILVGHHSERKARKDAERIESGMRKAISLWNTSQYWEDRARGALAHAEYKERPDVRHRRIKGIETDRRRQVREKEKAEAILKMWRACTTLERAQALADHDHLKMPDTLPDGTETKWDTVWTALIQREITPEIARTIGIKRNEERLRHSERWIEHYDHRLAYERAMLGEAGGIVASNFTLEVGGQVLEHGGWCVITKVNRTEGKVVSVTVATTRGKRVVSVEGIRDYRQPAEGDKERVIAATRTGPLVNYPGEGFRHMTEAEWKLRAQPGNAYYARRMAATETNGPYRLRVAPKVGDHFYNTVGVFLTDAKRVDIPPPSVRPSLPAPVLEALPLRVPARPAGRTAVRTMIPQTDPAASAVFAEIAKSLKMGVKVVSAHQLFPTPPALASRMVSLAKLQSGERVLEPSAGTGHLVAAMQRIPGIAPVVVEIDPNLANAFAMTSGGDPSRVHRADFLTVGAKELGTFDAIVMNPPFENAADVKHILHARDLLKPGGRIVAICADGPRQAKALKPVADTWEELPEGTFKSSGTNVRTVLLTIRKPIAKRAKPKLKIVAARKVTASSKRKRLAKRPGRKAA